MDVASTVPVERTKGDVAMYGIAVEYATGGGLPDPLERTVCRTALVLQPGYRRRLALMADGRQRVVDLFLYIDANAARAALAAESWRS